MLKREERELRGKWGQEGISFFFKTGENYSAPVGWWGWLSRKGNGKAGAGRTALVMSARWAGHTSGGVSLGTTSQTPRAQVQVGGCALAETVRVCFCFHFVSFLFFFLAAADFSVHNRSLDLSYSILVQKFALWEWEPHFRKRDVAFESHHLPILWIWSWASYLSSSVKWRH